MARQRKTELAAGIFVIAGAALLTGVVVWLGGLTVGGRYAYLTAPLAIGDTSIRTDSVVRVGTIDVGKVDRVTPTDDWQSFTYRIRLSGQVVIRQDARILATAPTLGGVGSLTIIDLGSPAAPPADRDHPARLHLGANPLVANMLTEIGYGPDQRTAFQEALTSINQTVQGLRDLTLVLQTQMIPGDPANLLGQAQATVGALRHAAESLDTQVTTMRAQLDPNVPEGMLSKLHRSLDNAELATDQAAGMLVAVRPGVQSAVTDVAQTARQLNAYTQHDVAELLGTLRQSSTALLAATNNLRDTTGSAGEMVRLGRGQVEEIVANLSQVSVNLKATSREVRRRPWLLLGESNAQDVRSRNIESAALAFADGARQLDQALDNLNGLAAGQDAEKPIPLDDPQLVLIRQRLDDSFERFTQAEQALWKELAP